MATPTTQRTFQARKAAYIRWATCDRDEHAAKIRDARWARLEARVDPAGTMRPAERRRRAEALMRAEMVALSAKAAAARAVKKLAQQGAVVYVRQCCQCEYERHGHDLAGVPGGKTDGLCKRHLAEFRTVYHAAKRLGIVAGGADHDHSDPLPAA